jgi:Xaa-Pro aminopeptidase
MADPTTVLDLDRMRRERVGKVRAELVRLDVAAAYLLTSGNVLYAGGAWMLAADNGRATLERTSVLVLRDDPVPHLFTPYPEGTPDGFPADHLHPPLWHESAAGVQQVATTILDLVGVTAGRIAVDDFTTAMWFGLPKLLSPFEVTNATPLLVDCRLHKTVDELECMRRSWRINEAATAAAEQALRPGMRLTDLTAIYFRRFVELGGTCNFLDPVWQSMPERIADGPWSTNGDVPFALVTADHLVSHGDVVWTDTVSGYEGYASDVGRTWVVGRPSRKLVDLYARWQDITDAVIDAIRPGVTGRELTTLAIDANGGTKPWLDHYFLAHTLGLEGGEPQRIGSDAGPEYDEQFALEPGMTIVIEPVVWQDGHMGYRCEELLFVTEDGNERVSRYPDEPFASLRRGGRA